MRAVGCSHHDAAPYLGAGFVGVVVTIANLPSFSTATTGVVEGCGEALQRAPVASSFIYKDLILCTSRWLASNQAPQLILP